MKDDLVAGKYYFLSAERTAEAQRLISIFLSRYDRDRNFAGLLSQFPQAAQIKLIELYPEPTRSDLRSMGMNDLSSSDARSGPGKRGTSCDEAERYWPGFFIFVFALMILFSIPIGLFQILKYLLRLLK